MIKYFENLAKAMFGVPYEQLSKVKQRVIKSIAAEQPIAENINEKFNSQLTFGQRLADRISAFGGSWTFIIIFILLMLVWVMINTVFLVSPEGAFDPYPFILLNLFLSSLAALQAPIIMMAQNRQAAKDRLDIAENYKISLKMDLEIIRLHQKLDALAGIDPESEVPAELLETEPETP